MAKILALSPKVLSKRVLGELVGNKSYVDYKKYSPESDISYVEFGYIKKDSIPEEVSDFITEHKDILNLSGRLYTCPYVQNEKEKFSDLIEDFITRIPTEIDNGRKIDGIVVCHKKDEPFAKSLSEKLSIPIVDFDMESKKNFLCAYDAERTPFTFADVEFVKTILDIIATIAH